MLTGSISGKQSVQHVISSLDDAAKWKLQINLAQQHIHVDVTDPNGAAFSIALEAANGKLVLQCNDPVHDEPLRVRLSASGLIETDDERGGVQIIHHHTFAEEAPR